MAHGPSVVGGLDAARVSQLPVDVVGGSHAPLVLLRVVLHLERLLVRHLVILVRRHVDPCRQTITDGRDLRSSQYIARGVSRCTVTSAHIKIYRLKTVAHTRLPSVGFRSRSRFLAVSLQVMWSYTGRYRLPLLSARPAVTPATLKRAATNFAAW